MEAIFSGNDANRSVIQEQQHTSLLHKMSRAKWQDSAILFQAVVIEHFGHYHADVHVTEEPQSRVPHVVLVIFIGIRRGEPGRAGKRGRGRRAFHCHASPCIGRGEE